MMLVGIMLGSTRPDRLGAVVAGWVHELAANRPDAPFELTDVAEYNLPLLDEHLPAALARYSNEHTKRWAAEIASFDAFVFVAAEYDHGIPGALKNATLLDQVIARGRALKTLRAASGD